MLMLKLIEQARERIKNIVVKTPLSYEPNLSSLAKANISLKTDNLQLTGSFTLRSAFNKIDSLAIYVLFLGLTITRLGGPIIEILIPKEDVASPVITSPVITSPVTVSPVITSPVICAIIFILKIENNKILIPKIKFLFFINQRAKNTI